MVVILGSNVDPNKRGSCKGRMNAYGNALVQACIQGYKRIVDLLLQPVYNVERKGPVYERAVSKAACGRPDENHGHVEILKSLLAKGEFANLEQVRRNVIGEGCYWGREDVVRMMLQDITIVNFWWQKRAPLQIATSRGHKSIVQLLLEHGAKPDW